MFIKKIHYLICIATAVTIVLAGCTIYRPEIQQGQLTDLEDVERLEIGMTPDEVQGILGTPLVVDTFNPDRWDYILNIVGTERTIVRRERVTIFFENGELTKVETVKPEEGQDTDTE